MKRPKNLLQTALGLSLAAGIATSPQALAAATDAPMNVIMILSDDHTIDGEDFSPLLRGEDWQRSRGIITYFPHSPPVPDWLQF